MKHRPAHVREGGLPLPLTMLYSPQVQEIDMLDAFIIDKIRRERESQDSLRIPLHIDVPRPRGRNIEEGRPASSEDEDRERGVAIIDFTI